MDDPRLDELRAAYASGELVLFVGPAVSTAAGISSAGELVEQSVARMRAQGAAEDLVAEIVELRARRGPGVALRAAREALGAADFDGLIERTLDVGERPLPELARALASLAPGLRAVLGVGLDRVLDRAFTGALDVLARPADDLLARRHFLLKLHGTLPERDTWIFARDRRRPALFDSPELEALFRALYQRGPLLCVGWGPDDGLDAHFAFARGRAARPAHFALLPWAKQRPAQVARLTAAGVRVHPPAHAGALPDLLRSLAALARAPAPPSAPRPTRSAPVQVVACFAAEDAPLFARLDAHLSALKGQRAIDLWHAGLILPGEDRAQQIDARLAKAGVVLLLMSAALLASDEGARLIERALARHRDGALHVVPVRLRACDWEGTGVEALPALPQDGSLIAGPNEDGALLAVARGLRVIVGRVRR